MPGAAFRADARIQAHYLHNGAEDPIVPVITLPAGTSVNAPGVARRLDGAFAAARTVDPDRASGRLRHHARPGVRHP